MQRRGIHYELAKRAVRCLQRAEFPIRTKAERTLEHSMVSALQANDHIRPHLLTQLSDDPVEKVTHAKVLGFKHRPDATIGNDGTALELKMVATGQPLREALGQAIAYRMAYRFVVLVLIDKTPGKRMVKLASDSNSPGNKLLKAMAKEMGIFTVVAPRRNDKAKGRHEYDHVAFL